MSREQESRTSDFTDKDAITAGRMVGSGKSWLDVVCRLYPDLEYPELLVEITRERFLYWYRLQTPERLMEVLSQQTRAYRDMSETRGDSNWGIFEIISEDYPKATKDIEDSAADAIVTDRPAVI